jgi:hypothetical protein
MTFGGNLRKDRALHDSHVAFSVVSETTSSQLRITRTDRACQQKGQHRLLPNIQEYQSDGMGL